MSPTPSLRTRTVASVAVAAVLALSSCGGDEPADAPATAAPPDTTDAPETTTDTADAPEVGAPIVPASDPLLDQQWGLAATNIPRAWAATGGEGVTIAIVDSGVDLDHPDLVDRLVPGRDFVDGDDRPDDPNGHGTHVAGIAAASSNDIGIAGAAPLASIMPIRVLDADGAGDDDTIAEAVRWAADNGADVINLSLGESGFISRFTRGSSLNRAIRDVAADGVVVIAAAGNEGTAGQQYRIGVDVLVVNATDPTGAVTAFSNVGDVRSISAPGAQILSTAPTEPTTIWPGGTSGYEPLDGTSMATPLVSGVAALALAGGIDPVDLVDVLADTAVNASGDPALGAGMVDTTAAIGLSEAVDDTDPSPAPPTTVAPVTPPDPALPEPPAGGVEETLRQALEQLDTPLDATCTTERRRLTVVVSAPSNELGLVVTGELLVALFDGAGSYPATGDVEASIPGQEPIVIPVAGTATVDDTGAGSVTIPLGEASATLTWLCR